ncbi:hypothetical protein ACFYYR_16390 [Streptomyces sp. NPDC001922]|uniref:hypothetical protein n=1 Tax=Streptomyces sp. NPDC001922 TaxID=3364624 RepID=UPI00369B70AA
MRKSITAGLTGALVAVTALAGTSVASAEPQPKAGCPNIGYPMTTLQVRDKPFSSGRALGTVAQGKRICIYGATSHGGKATECGDTSHVWLETKAPGGSTRRGWVFEPCVRH